MIRVLVLLTLTLAAFAQRPLKFLPCMMCEILDSDTSAKVLSYFAEYNGVEYAFDSDAHHAAFLRDPEVWLTWNDVEPEAPGHATLVPS